MPITVKRPEGVVEFCTDQSLRLAWESATDELDQIRKLNSERTVNPAVAEVAERVQAIESEMDEATVVFKLRALPRRRWQELVLEYPPREDNETDEGLGVNQSLFFDAVLVEPGVLFAVNEKVSNKPVGFDVSAEWNDLADEMTDAQWNDFASKILELNRSITSVPKSWLASRLMETSDAK